MDNDEKLLEISFSMVAGEHNRLVLDDFVLLNDNLDEEQPIVGQDRMELARTVMPFKFMFTMVLICVKGGVRMQVNLMDYVVKANDVIMVTPGSIISEMEVEEGSRMLMMAFPGERNTNDAMSFAPAAVRKYFMRTALFHGDAEDIEHVTDIYRLMRKTIQWPSEKYAKEAITHYLQILTCSFSYQQDKFMEQQDYARPTRQEEIMMDFMQEVHDHCLEHRELKYYAERLCLSPSYLAHIISETSGRHASEWIKDAVILEAKAMLRAGGYTVQQVSNALNFPNQSFFGKYFKAAVGTSPRQYQLRE